MNAINRRTLLGATLAGMAGLAAPASAHALTRARAVTTTGTTLAMAAAPVGGSGYGRLTAGPGYPLVVREDLCAAKAGRDDRRAGLAALGQLTDLHMVDAQSPVRFEWLTTVNGSAFRPQEALGTQGGACLVRRINSLSGGPFTGLPLSCVVSTGDNTDNHETVELDWFLRLLSGGSITPDTGAVGRWEGVQTSGDRLYYNPELPVADRYQQAGFPRIEGFFDRATAAHVSPGLRMPWYSVFGNHDNSIAGVLPGGSALAALYTGSLKLNGIPDPALGAAFAGSRSGATVAGVADLDRPKSGWVVTPDARRRPFTPREYIAAHLAPDAAGAGPVGHGFTPEHAATGRGYYTFRIAPGITGIALDSTNRAGFTEGSLDDVQWRWLQRVLVAGSSRYDDAFGIEQRRPGTADELFVLFSHHTSGSMGNLLLPLDGTGIRHSGGELLRLLGRFPNVLAWVNGHSHTNAITPRRGRTPSRSFWEINTASHIDFPQHARLVEVADNADGTLSLFTTLVEAQSPYQAAYDDGSQQGLGSLYRELSFNDLGAKAARLGGPGDRNTELLLANPLGTRVG